jgi:hypothetical protein
MTAATAPEGVGATAVAEPWVTLFNRPAFHALNLTDGQRILDARVHAEDGRLVGALTGVVSDDVFVSGHSAPYGGVDLARDRETPAHVAALVDGALARLRDEGVQTARVRLPPPCLGTSEGLVEFTLLNRGFRVERCELNQHVDLTGLPDADAYRAALRSPARRALKPLLADPAFRFEEATTPAAWDRAYATLAANRAARGRRLSLSRDYVERARHALGGAVTMHELLRDEDAVAAALVYRVRPGCALVVAWGDAGHGLERSPMNLLAHRVVEQALADGVRILDLGASNEPEPGPSGGLEANGGLVQFKQSVLARTHPRLTLVKELA